MFIKALSVLALLFTCNALSAQAQETERTAAPVTKVVDEMPRFYSYECESIMDEDKRKQCADMAMLETVYKNITYPPNAKKDGIEGTVVISFTIDMDGMTSDFKVTRSIREDLDQEALRVVRDKLVEWEPGKQKGMPVNTQFNMPVRFRLK
ncbi:energy transducer TonB [Phaeodactylibacter xiamenensis]|uniref:energy transducer TonB n=1 Tax=Phaeodactylibacter xiamenensis TaxID=1524460 RepID=UPI003BA9F538